MFTSLLTLWLETIGASGTNMLWPFVLTFSHCIQNTRRLDGLRVPRLASSVHLPSLVEIGIQQIIEWCNRSQHRKGSWMARECGLSPAYLGQVYSCLRHQGTNTLGPDTLTFSPLFSGIYANPMVFGYLDWPRRHVDIFSHASNSSASTVTVARS
jgi:hypothetical protein